MPSCLERCPPSLTACCGYTFWFEAGATHSPDEGGYPCPVMATRFIIGSMNIMYQQSGIGLRTMISSTSESA